MRVSAAGAALAGRAPAALAVRPAGALVAVWRQLEGGGLRLHASLEGDPLGGSWEAPVALTPVTRRIGAPVMESAPDGRTILAYAMDGAIYVRALTPDGLQGWSAPRRLSGANRGCASPSVAFDTGRKAIVAFSCGGGRRLLMVGER